MRTPIDRQATGDEQTLIGRPLTVPIAVRYEAGAVLCGKYRLEVLLGEGGMGAVWRASNLHLDLPVAIKLIRADLDRSSLRARLQLEARAAAKLAHPAIVRVYDVGESELGDPFIVMEHLRGETLAQQLASQGRLPATRAVQLLLPIIDALAMAHGRGIVHRDLKPDNLMIALEGQHVRPKILDFGIAKLTEPGDSQHRLTEFGAVVGSPEYMSPEQARGCEDIDASSDIWSICVVLYEAVTGCSAFSASNCNALLRSIVEDDPKPLSEHAAGDDELWEILERGLAKDRARRYAEISELGRALAGWLLDRGVTEDACGSGLDSKWLNGRSKMPSLARATSVQLTSDQLSSNETHDTTPDSSGIVRGPFTATIRSAPSTRRLTLGAALSGCALLGATLLALGHSRPVTLSAAAARELAVKTTLPAVAAAPLPAPLETVVAAAVTAPEPSAASSGSSEPVAKPPSDGVRSTKPIVGGARVSTPVANPPAMAAPPPAAPANRPLDLLSPY